MKKTTVSSVLLVGLSLALTGCGSQAVNNAATDASSTKNAAQASNNGRGGRMPDFGQPKTPPDIRGIIKTIVGNEVDVLKLDMSRRNATSTGATGQGNAQTAPAISLTGGTRGGGGGFGGPGGGRQGGQGGGQLSETDRAAMIKRLEAMSTGEEKVIIPVGIKMLKFSNTNGKREAVEATLSDLAADKSITIWLNNSVTDKKVAEFVLIN